MFTRALYAYLLDYTTIQLKPPLQIETPNQ